MLHSARLSLCTTPSMLLLSLLPLPSSATELVRPRPLVEYADIQLAQELDTALANLNGKVSHCVDSGENHPSACRCHFRTEAEVTQASYEKVLQARPKWKGKILYWKNPDNLSSHHLVMPAIAHQLNAWHACGSPQASTSQ
jgi:hypothetical protein